MHFHQILLFIIHKLSGQRSENAPYYLIKGKKSGQTIQDVTYFQLSSFFLYSSTIIDRKTTLLKLMSWINVI